MRRLGLVIFIVYLVIGVFVARSEGYFKGVDDLQSVVSAVLGVALWPLVLLGVNLEIGGGDKAKKGGDKKRGGDKGLLLPLALWKAQQLSCQVLDGARHRRKRAAASTPGEEQLAA